MDNTVHVSEQTPLLGNNAINKPKPLPRSTSAFSLFVLAQLILVCLLIGVLLYLDTIHDANPQPNTTTPFQIVSTTYLQAFYNGSHNHFFKDTNRDSWNDFWMEAIAWEVVMDMYQANNSYRAMVDDVYDGFMDAWSDMNATCNTPANSTATLPPIQNPCNDDVMWWARASARAYELTGNQRYLTCSQRLFDHVYASWDNTTLGGGILWGCAEAARLAPQVHRPQGFLTSYQKNVATNAPSVITGVKLAQALNSTAYLAKAVRIYQWLENTLANNKTGVVNDNYDRGQLQTWQFTYNYGTMIGAAMELYTITNDVSYLSRAYLYAETSFNRLTQSNTSVLQYEGAGDAGGFAGIYLRHLCQLSKIPTPPALNATQPTTADQTNFIVTNAQSAWTNRRSDNLMAGNWLKPAPTGDLQTHMVGSAVAAVILAGL